MKLKKIFISLSFLLVLFTPAIASAAPLPKPILSPEVIAEAECKKGSICSLNAFVRLGISVSDYILTIVGALALVMFIFGGLMWILSGGSSDKVQKGKDILIGSVVGLIIVFSSYLIIKFATQALSGTFSSTAPPDPIDTRVSSCDNQSKPGSVCVDDCGAYGGEALPTPKGCFTDDTGVCCIKPTNCGSEPSECKESTNCQNAIPGKCDEAADEVCCKK